MVKGMEMCDKEGIREERRGGGWGGKVVRRWWEKRGLIGGGFNKKRGLRIEGCFFMV